MELEIDPRTGMKNYIANGQNFPYHLRTDILTAFISRKWTLGHVESVSEAYTRKVHPSWKAVSISRKEG